MGLISIDGGILKKMLISGANELTRSSRAIDALNVFPVPDGDTGINMSHTVQAAAKEVARLNTPNVYDVAKAASNGSLRGARGNSGVILSQLFRGFAKGLEGKATADIGDLADAMTKATETAYKAIMKPKEGTILTIACALSEQAQACVYDDEDIESVLRTVINHGQETLNKTPSMLPELRQAGVVDAGGMGLLCIFKGALASLSVKGEIALQTDVETADAVQTVGFNEPVDIRFAYCTEVLIESEGSAKCTGTPEEALKQFLPGIGDSIVVVSDESITKVHVHTNHPGLVLEHALKFGYLSNIKIENMHLQHTSLLQFSTPSKVEKEIGFVAVAQGKGMCELFTGLGADRVIEGGQTMNPSANDIVDAIAKVHARHVIVLPNNKNIILAAKQAAELSKAGKTVHIVPTRSVPQGIACLINYVEAASTEDNLAAMNEAIQSVHCGQVTYAVRDTVVKDRTIKSGDMLCLYDGDIVTTAGGVQQAAQSLIDYMLAEGGEMVSIYYGEETTAEMAEGLKAYIAEKYPDCEIELYNGQQPLYYYILSVE